MKIIYQGSANRLSISKNDRKMNRKKDIVSDENEIKSVKKVQNLMWFQTKWPIFFDKIITGIKAKSEMRIKKVYI